MHYGYKAVLSGPAGGVVGYVNTTYQQFNGQPLIGFDMGGTSTDVSRYSGEYEHVFENVTAGVRIQAPQLDINTVAGWNDACWSSICQSLSRYCLNSMLFPFC